METRKRSVVKALIWRFIASSTTVIIIVSLAGGLKLGLTVAAIGVIVKLILYYFYERTWSGINWENNKMITIKCPECGKEACTYHMRCHNCDYILRMADLEDKQ